MSQSTSCICLLQAKVWGLPGLGLFLSYLKSSASTSNRGSKTQTTSLAGEQEVVAEGVVEGEGKTRVWITGNAEDYDSGWQASSVGDSPVIDPEGLMSSLPEGSLVVSKDKKKEKKLKRKTLYAPFLSRAMAAKELATSSIGGM